MIVKVQQSQATTEDQPQMLIYNKDRSVLYSAALDKSVKKLLGKRPKAYFLATIKDTRIQLLAEVDAQNW